MLQDADISEQNLIALVNEFYRRVRSDTLIGPIFEGAISDWPHHLEKLTAFWSSVMLRSGRYKGQPVPAHFGHRDTISPGMFERWLALWRQTTDELMSPPAAAALQAKAARIAESLSLALFFTLPAPSASGRAPA